MLESRRNSRREVHEINCDIYLNDRDKITRTVLNISSGGMLLEKDYLDERTIYVGETYKMLIIFSEDYNLFVSGKIIRKQERSMAIMFLNLNKEQEKFLKAISL